MWVHFQMYKLSHPKDKLKHFLVFRASCEEICVQTYTLT